MEETWTQISAGVKLSRDLVWLHLVSVCPLVSPASLTYASEIPSSYGKETEFSSVRENMRDE